MAGIGTNIGWNQVNKKVTKATRKTTKGVNELVIPRSKTDVAMYAIPYGRAAKIAKRAVGGITKAGAKYVEKVYRNIG